MDILTTCMSYSRTLPGRRNEKDGEIMADVPKIVFSEAAAYLKNCKKGLILGEWIGGGGFGDVYEVYGAEAPMVVKIMDTRQIVASDQTNALIKRQRREAKKRLEEEVAIMSLLKDCRYVMPLLDWSRIDPMEVSGIGLADSSVCVMLLFMPKLIPLTQHMGNNPWKEADVLQMMQDITSALCVCAEHQITHFDLKPDNIFVAQGPDRTYYVLGDFGVAQRESAPAKGNPRLRGYSPYRAPECFSEQMTPGRNADIYSLGVVAYQCLTQTYPYPQCAVGIDVNPPEISHISQALFDILKLMLQRNPTKRCDHPKILAERLKEVCVHGGYRTKPQQCAPQVRKLLMKDDLDAAIQVAAEGMRNQEDSCVRLMAVAVSRQEPQNWHRFRSAKTILAEQCLNEDAASIFLRGYLSGRMGEWKEFAHDMELSAKAGYIPACYLYGRTLLYGDRKECPMDPERGMRYLIQAAEADYFPANRLVQREMDLYPYLKMSEKLRKRLMTEEYCSDDPRERESLYEWL